MSLILRILLIVMSIVGLCYIIWKIRHSKLQIEYTLFWIVLAFLMILMAIFPGIVYWVTSKLGMISPANVVYLFIIAVLLLKSFMMTIEISNLENKVKDLVQQIGINEKEHNQAEQQSINGEQKNDK